MLVTAPDPGLDHIAASPATQPVARFSRKYDTIAHEILDLESFAAPVDQSMYDLLDSIIDEALQRIRPRPYFESDAQRRLYATAVFMTIDQILTRRHFLYPHTGEGVDLLSDALRIRHFDEKELAALLAQDENARRKGISTPQSDCHLIDCDLTCFIYISVAQVLGLPVSMVEVPGHNFVRWYIDDGSYLNFETVYAGWRDDTEEYSRYFRSTSEYYDLVSRGVFLARMTQQDVLGYALLLRGECYERQDRLREAMDDYRTSMALYPRSPVARARLAWLLATCPDVKSRNLPMAQRLAAQACAQWENPKLLDIEGCIDAQAGDFEAAAREEKRAYAIEADAQFAQRAEAFSHRLTYFEYLRTRHASVSSDAVGPSHD